MKAKLTGTNLIIVAVLGFIVLAFIFWTLLLSPKREEAKKLDAKVAELETSLATHEAEVTQALEAREEYPERYQQLVVLGKAVPGDDDTASLIVQLHRIADRVKIDFDVVKLAATSGEAAAPPAPAPPTEEAAAASPTEVAASTLPLGATIGPAGLAVMPYDLTFEGKYFQVANFMKELDSLVRTENAKVAVTGRLFTVNGFSLKAAQSAAFPMLEATFSVTTYLTPPTEEAAGGVAPTEPETAVPASARIGGTP